MIALCVSLTDSIYCMRIFVSCCARTLSDHDSKVEVHQSYKNSWDFLTARNVSWKQIRQFFKFRESFTSSDVYTIQKQVFWIDRKISRPKELKQVLLQNMRMSKCKHVESYLFCLERLIQISSEDKSSCALREMWVRWKTWKPLLLTLRSNSS